MKRLPTMRQLQYLAALADTQHFGKAAQRCFISQSTLSAGIRDLESVLGTPVAERSNRRVLITKTGSRLAARARVVLRDVGDMMDAARSELSPMGGDVHLGVIPTIAPFIRPCVFPILRERFPELTVYLKEEQSAPLLERLQEGELDALLIALPYDTEDLCVDVIMQDEFLFACPPDHPLAGVDVVPIEALAKEHLMMLEEGHCLRDQTLEACGTNGSQPQTPFQAASLRTLVQMVAGGIGVTILPQVSVNADITHGTDISVSRLSTRTFRQIALVWRPTSPRGEAMRILAGALRELVTMRRNDGEAAN